MHHGSGNVNNINGSFYFCRSFATLATWPPAANQCLSELSYTIRLWLLIEYSIVSVNIKWTFYFLLISFSICFISFRFIEFSQKIKTIFYKTIKVFVELQWLLDTNLFDRNGTWKISNMLSRPLTIAPRIKIKDRSSVWMHKYFVDSISRVTCRSDTVSYHKFYHLYMYPDLNGHFDAE